MTLAFQSSLLREKFTLRDPAGDLSDAPPVIALSNRLVLPLHKEGEEPETFVVRAQNMHSCARLGAAIAKEYLERGALMRRVLGPYWQNLWSDVIKGYEKDWNPAIWCAIYFRGRLIYESGERHPFLDIIEQCDAVNKGDYAETLAFAEQAFQQAGRTVNIEHDSNVALILAVTPEEAKCGIILRAANRKTTFNYTAKAKKGGEKVRVPTVLTISAAFLEGVQLAFDAGLSNRKKALGLIERFSNDDKRSKRGAERLANLTRAIEAIERKYIVSYRPDRPDFQLMVREAEDVSMKILKPLIDAKIASGELDASDWIT
ncbi:MAG: hypothetical protein WC989_04545 [Micavibrio sp.]